MIKVRSIDDLDIEGMHEVTPIAEGSQRAWRRYQVENHAVASSLMHKRVSGLSAEEAMSILKDFGYE